jgi:hypothetical protein
LRKPRRRVIRIAGCETICSGSISFWSITMSGT